MFDLSISITLGFGLVALILGYLSVTIDKKHGVLQYLFLSASLISIFLMMALYTQLPEGVKIIEESFTNTTTNITQTNTTLSYSQAFRDQISAGYEMYIWVFVLTLFYFIIFFIFQILTNMGKIGNKTE